MLHKIKKSLHLLISVIAISTPLMLLPAMASASGYCNNIQQNINTGINSATGGSGQCGNANADVTSGIKHIAVVVINILSIVVGIVAVIMIIYGGFRYITSGGESGSVSSAKNTLIYAIVGLILVALAQVIVHWVLNTSTQFSTPGAVLIFRSLL